MLMELVCKDNPKELGNSGKEQVRMERFLILCFSACKTEGIFYMIDGAFNGCPDLISYIPIWSAS